MIPVWVIALLTVLGAVCLALPLHIGMTGICLLLLAAVLLALRLLKKKNAPKHWSRLLTGLTAAGMAVIFGAMGYIAMQGQDSVMTQDETPEFVVVLGAQVQGGGPSLTLKKRLDKTLEFMQEHPDRTVIVSGGQGEDEPITEAQCMHDELVKLGISEDRIWMEDKSTSTDENLRFSLQLIEEKTGERPKKLAFLSSEYHLFRTSLMAKKLGIEFEGVPAKTSNVTQLINHAMREVAGVWHFYIFGR